jgi:tripeptide aminopeptidase
MNTELFYSILQTESESGNQREMADLIRSHCEAKGYAVTSDALGNLYVTSGTAKTYPCIASHMDTVHDIHGHGITLLEINGNLTGFDAVAMRQTGIGGDDKCGIYAALHCLAHLPACKAAFFVDEEIGCVGSESANLAFFHDCRFVLQADRRGNADFVTDISGPLASSRFAAAVAPLLARHGYSPCKGAMSDVMALRDAGVGISVANMSAGYYNPHQACEYVNLADLAKVCALMLDICATCTRVYKFRPIRPSWGYKRDRFPSWPASYTTLENEADDMIDSWPHAL